MKVIKGDFVALNGVEFERSDREREGKRNNTAKKETTGEEGRKERVKVPSGGFSQAN